MSMHTDPARPSLRADASLPSATGATTSARRNLGVSLDAEFDGAVLEASLEVSLGAGREPLQLVFRATVQQMNEALGAQFADSGIPDAGLPDVSPEATAGRILALSVGFFDAYASQNPGEDYAQQVQDFVGIISKGIARGFEEARGILQGLGVLEGKIAADVDATEALVKKGLEAFTAEKLKPAA